MSDSVNDLYRVEYERLKEEQKTRISVRDNLIYANLASTAAVITAAVAAKGHASLLLLLPPATVVLGWTYLVNDEKVSAIGRYVRDRLGPALNPGGAPGVFGWEVEHRSDPRRRSRKLLQVAVDLLTFAVPAFSAIVFYWANGPWHWPLLLISFAELVAVGVLAFEIVRYADLGVGATPPASAARPRRRWRRATGAG
ncbi:MAG TPA: hypothetical protein VN408_23595 [Actinoplanes sp.]|nr:hypothetical protein [Actinoplanes sp.]